MPRYRTPTVVLAVLLLIAACASIPPDRQVLNSLETIKASSVASMTVIGNLYKEGLVNDTQKAQATLLYNRIQAGCRAVAASVQTVTTVQQGADLTAPLQQFSVQLSNLVVLFQKGGSS